MGAGTALLRRFERCWTMLHVNNMDLARSAEVLT
jgi:hypothetical protein